MNRSASIGKRSVWIVLAALAVFAVGRGAGWYHLRSQQVAAQQEFAAYVQSLGGYTYYDYQLRDQATQQLADDDGDQSQPHWLSAWIGKDWLHDIFYVSFAQFSDQSETGGVAARRDEVTDEVLRQAIDLPGLRWLALTGTGVTDQGIARLCDSRLQVERLWLSQTRITDQAVVSLSACPSLTHVYIEGTATTDRAVATLARLPRLQTLSLGSPYITAGGLLALGQSTQLRELYLDRLPVDDRVLARLAALQQLRTLSLRGTQVSDTGLAALAKLASLHELFLDGTAVTGEAFAAGISPATLTVLTLNSTQIEDSQLPALQSYRKLSKLGVRDTACTLTGLVKLLVDLQDRTLSQALQVISDPQVNADGEVVALDFSGFELQDGDVAILAQLPELQWLSMRGSRISDEGADRLAELELPKLSLLNLNESQLTDTGLARLAEIETLRSLHVAGTKVTTAAIEVQQTERPGLRIYTTDLRAKQRIVRATDTPSP